MIVIRKEKQWESEYFFILHNLKIRLANLECEIMKCFSIWNSILNYNKTVLRKMKWATVNHSKSWYTSKESDSVYMVGLEGDCVLCAPSTKLDAEFR